MLPNIFSSPFIPGDTFFNSIWPILLSAFVGTLFGVRYYFKGTQCRSIGDLSGKVVIVTGASSGIGLELTRAFLSAGARVVMACRDKGKTEKVILELRTMNPNYEVKFIRLDLASFASVKKFVSEFKLAESKLDILVNNGGIVNHKECITLDGHEIHYQVNYLSHFLLTQLLLDVIQETPGSRIINNTAHAYKLAQFKLEGLISLTSSDVNSNTDYLHANGSSHDLLCCDSREASRAKFSQTSSGGDVPELESHEKAESCLSKDNSSVTAAVAYAQSKLAMILFTKKLASKYGNSPLAYVANPGVVRTNLYKNMPFQKNVVLAFILAPFLWFFMKTPSDGAQTALYCATTPGLKSGDYFCECSISRLEDNTSSDKEADLLWSCSRKACGL